MGRLGVLLPVAMAVSAMGALLVLLSPPSAVVAQAHPDASPSQAGGVLLVDVQGSEAVLAGREITYTLFVTNNSELGLSNVVITDVWGKQVYNGNYQLSGNLQGAASTFVTVTAPYINWRLNLLPAGATGAIVMTMWVPSALQPAVSKSPVDLTNVAVITHTTPEVQGSRDSLESRVVGPILVLSKNYTPAYVRPGRLVTYVLQLANASTIQRVDSITATGVVVTDRVPVYADVWSVSGAPTIEYSPTTRIVTWRLSQTVDPSQTAYLTLTLRVSETLSNATSVSTNIRNLKAHYGVAAAELPLAVPGSVNVYVNGEDVVEKAVQVGPPPPASGNPKRTFPDRVITYTIAVYNPLTQPVAGFVVTDTLPQSPDGGPYFVYSDTFAVEPFTAPTVISVAGKIVGWELPPIAGWDVYTFGLRVRVPPQMDTAVLSGRIYDNSVIGTRPFGRSGEYTNLAPAEGKVRVLPQIIPNKTVVPSQQLPGRPVTFTVTAANVGDTLIRDIWLTDTLPGGFTFVDRVDGPPPFITTPVIGWQPITLSAYSSVTYTYSAIADGTPLKSFCSQVGGYSPDTFVPTRINLACVYILSPYRMDKTAGPSPFVLGDTFAYTISIANVGVVTAEMSSLTDHLPVGFYYTDGVTTTATFYDIYSPTIVLPPGAAPYTRTFMVEARSVQNMATCNKLPVMLYQLPGNVTFQISAPLPAGEFTNASDIGGAMVYPQVVLANTAQLPGAVPGESITYTIWLTNLTSITRSQLVITDILPAGFQFLGMVDFRAPDQIIPGTSPKVIWRNVELGPWATLSLTLVARAALTPADNMENLVQVISASDPHVCVPWLGGGNNARSGARINVRYKQLTITKSAAPAQVARSGRVYYKVTVTNRGPYTAYDAIITDVLPFYPPDSSRPFQFIGMQLPTPPGLTLISTDPPVWRIAWLEASKNIQFTFSAQATIYPWSNYINGITGSLSSGWTLTPESSFRGAPVEVVDSLAPDIPTDLSISASVSPTDASPGDLIVYTLIFSNAGPFPASAVVITDVLPAIVTNPTVDGDRVDVVPTGDDNLTWNVVGALEADDWGVITITGMLANPPASGAFVNTATIANQAGADTQPENNTSSVWVTVTVGPSSAHTLSASAVGGGIVTLDPAGGVYNEFTLVTLTAQANSGWRFDHWGGDASGMANPVTVFMDGDKAVTATFAQSSYALAVSTSGTGSGTVTKTPNQVEYTHGTMVTLTANASANSTFAGWSGDANGILNPVTLLMDSHKTVAATFVVNRYALTVTLIGDGQGAVAQMPNQATYLHGTVVTLTANAGAGTTFAGWSGDVNGILSPVMLSMDSDKTVTAMFTLNRYALTVNMVGNGQGTVTQMPSREVYQHGTVVTLTANAGLGSTFAGWSGDANGILNPVTLSMDGNKAVTATFTSDRYLLVVSVSGTGNGTVTKTPDQADYAHGTMVTLTANAGTGSTLAGWGGACADAAGDCVLTMDGHKAVIAIFDWIGDCVPVDGADFTWAPSLPLAGQTVAFSAMESMGAIPLAYDWMFGDQTTGSGVTMAHLFPFSSATHAYTVTLTVSNACPSHKLARKAVIVTPRRFYMPVLARVAVPYAGRK